MDETAVYLMPRWVTDGTLSELLPVLARAYAHNFTRTEHYKNGK
jgi:hypothetical protein